MSRDTQFQGFASLLCRELCEEGSCVLTEEDELVIARRAYDFAKHVWNETVSNYENVALKDIPDMTEWPKEQEA